MTNKHSATRGLVAIVLLVAAAGFVAKYPASEAKEATTTTTTEKAEEPLTDLEIEQGAVLQVFAEHCPPVSGSYKAKVRDLTVKLFSSRARRQDGDRFQKVYYETEAKYQNNYPYFCLVTNILLDRWDAADAKEERDEK